MTTIYVELTGVAVGGTATCVTVASMKVRDRLSSLGMPGMLRVPEITAWFWIAKGLSTAMGEATSDYLLRVLGPIPPCCSDSSPAGRCVGQRRCRHRR